jgi:hypothetical protein
MKHALLRSSRSFLIPSPTKLAQDHDTVGLGTRQSMIRVSTAFLMLAGTIATLSLSYANAQSPNPASVAPGPSQAGLAPPPPPRRHPLNPETQFPTRHLAAILCKLRREGRQLLQQ